MLAAASFGILAVLVRRIRMIIGIALVTGSLIGFVLTNFELTRLGYQTEGFTDQTRLYYGVLQYSLGVFLVTIIGGLVVIAYYMVARYPLRKRLRG